MNTSQRRIEVTKPPNRKTFTAITGLENAAKCMEMGDYSKTPISPLNKGTDWKHITLEQLWSLMHDEIGEAAIKAKIGLATSIGLSSPSKLPSVSQGRHRKSKPRAKGSAGKARRTRVP